MFRDLWLRLPASARWGLVAGLLCVLLALLAVVPWLLRGQEQVLFTDLKPQDAAALSAELDKLKTPYRVGADGATLYVDASVVHATRMKLMGREAPLHGASGFELFNGGDFGMTEFAQKVNYQRALQGEITRTILALDEVREARVHLALPEDNLFRRNPSRPKAAITLGIRPGQALRPEQVSGIQRLVAGAVPGMLPQDVTIVDQQGVALTRAAPVDGELVGGAGRLDIKRDTEALLARKATEVLERAFGVGQALATVDVTLSMDQVRVTTEDVIGTPAGSGQVAAGVIVREREFLREATGSGPEGAPRAGAGQREVDYQVGKRVEQVVTPPGAIRRLHVAAVVRTRLDARQLDEARALVSAAVGSLADRGDTVLVQSLASYAMPAANRPFEAASGVPPAPGNSMPAPTSRGGGLDGSAAWLLLALLALGAGALALKARSSRGRPAAALTRVERDALALQMQEWMAQERSPAPGRPVQGRDLSAEGLR